MNREFKHSSEFQKNKKLIILLITVCLFVIVFLVLILFNSNNRTKEIEKGSNNDSIEVEKGNIIFKDISFLNVEKIDHFVQMYNNYLFYNNKFYDLDGNVVFDGTKYDYIDFYNQEGLGLVSGEKYDYITVCKDSSCGVIDNKFNIIVPVLYYDLDIKSNNYIVLKEHSKKTFSIFDVKNKIMYENYSNVKYINDNFILVKKDDNLQQKDWKILRFTDSNADSQNKTDMYNLNVAENFKNKYIIISKNIDGKEMYGVVDSSFNEIVPFSYNDIDNVNDEYLLLKFDNRVQIITLDKKEILILNDVNVERANAKEKVIWVSERNPDKPYYRTFTYYDLESNLLYKYSDMDLIGYIPKYLSNDTYLFYNGRKCFYLNSDTKKKIDNSSFCNSYNKRANKYIIKEEADGETLYNLKFNPIFKQHYDEIVLYDNFCLVKIDNKYYVYSFDERKILEESFDYYFENDDSLILANQKKDNEKDLNYYYFKYEKIK